MILIKILSNKATNLLLRYILYVYNQLYAQNQNGKSSLGVLSMVGGT